VRSLTLSIASGSGVRVVLARAAFVLLVVSYPGSPHSGSTVIHSTCSFHGPDTSSRGCATNSIECTKNEDGGRCSKNGGGEVLAA
jgi:hypothetical protein